MSRWEKCSNIWKKIYVTSVAGCLVLTSLLAGCGSEETPRDSSSGVESGGAPSVQVDYSGLTTPGVNVDLVGEYKEKDLDDSWNVDEATRIMLSNKKVIADGVNAQNTVIGNGELTNQLTITVAGTYVLNGNYEDDLQVVVNVGDEDQVHLVLNEVTVSNNVTAPIYIANADKVYISLEEGTNNLIQDTRAAYVEEETEAKVSHQDALIEAAIFSEVDVVFNGEGSLTVEAGFDDGVRTKDDLKLVSGTYHVTCQDDAFVGKGSISIRGGNYTTVAKGTAFKSNNEDDLEKGFVVVDGGKFDLIATEGDGFHGEFVLVINDGDILIRQCEEGLEAMNILIHGGNIELTAMDDGVNISEADNYSTTFGVELQEQKATDADSSTRKDVTMSEIPTDFDPMQIPKDFDWNQPPEGMERPEGMEMPEGFDFNQMQQQDTAVDHIPGALIITGGTLKVTAQGDGLDSNGDILIAGGETVVCGPTAADNGSIDYADTFQMVDGVIAVSGNRGMEQSILSETIPVLTVSFDNQQMAETKIVIADDSGKEIFGFTARQAFGYVSFASAVLDTEKIYTVTAGSMTKSETPSMSMHGGMDMGPGGLMPGGERGPMPEGFDPGQAPGQMPSNRGTGISTDSSL